MCVGVGGQDQDPCLSELVWAMQDPCVFEHVWAMQDPCVFWGHLPISDC